MEFHILRGIDTHDKKFIELIPSLIEKISKDFTIEKKDLDFSPQSLSIIDVYLIENYTEFNEDFIKEYTIPLTAYLGEVWIKNKGGKWNIEYSKEFNKFSPIINFNTRILRFYECIFAELSFSSLPAISSCYWAKVLVP